MRGLVCLLTITALGCSGDPDSMVQTITVPTQVDATFTSPTCTVGIDGTVTLTGELSLDGLGARLIFRNNQKGTHENTDEFTATTVVIPAEEMIVIPPPAIVIPPETAPVIYVQFFDPAGNAVTGEILLGPCDSVGFPASATVAVATTVTLAVSIGGCSNHPGPTISVDGAVVFDGLQARIIVRTAEGQTTGAVVASAEIVALAAGETHTIPKQPSRGGVGGNPWIWAQLIDAAGEPVSDEIALGRCVQDGGAED